MKTNSKSKSGFKGFFNKKENIVITAVALVFCAGLVVTEMKAGEIPLHDGDVLVDSRNIAKEEESGEFPPENSEESSGLTEEGNGADEDDESGKSAAGSDVFSAQRAKLEMERSDLIGKYDDTIKNSTNDAEKKNAVASKEKLTDYMEQEVAVTNIISGKNLPDCLVIITDSTVTVTVDERDLDQNTAAKICSIIMAETGRSADKIVIQSNY